MALNEAFKEFSIEGKAALVIGAELPLGAAAAAALAEAGANLVLASQDPGTGDQLKELAKKISAMGRKAVVQVQSAISRADLSACMDLTVKELGALDILVNALDVPFFAPVEGTDDTAFERVIENNFKTFWTACQEAGRTMIQRGGGVIVNLTSIMAERGVPNATLYGAAQAAVLNLTRGLALEWARKNVRVNAIEMGWVEDPRSPAVNDEEFAKTLVRYLPEQRLLKPEELGGALLYLVSPAAAYVTGQSIAIDGGLLCRV
ncbi:MAG TPA: SDR family oxidoreductase [Candidatus Binataceae bacterium]|nr:SDR family oxidoreductase [Candidatus Binataceae bacterium]